MGQTNYNGVLQKPILSDTYSIILPGNQNYYSI